MLIDFNDDEIKFIEKVVNASNQFPLTRVYLLAKIKEAEEKDCCRNCKNGHCKHSLQSKLKLHGECRNHNRFESVRD